MRNYIVCIFTLVCIFLIPISVNAVEINDYINSNGVEIPINMYLNLQQIYSDAYIDSMTQDDYDRIYDMNLDFSNVSTSKKYIKTEYNNITGQTVNTEITEAEFMAVNPTEVQNSPQATIIETGYKRLTLHVTSISSEYAFFTFSCYWKVIPATRSFDVIGARLSGFNTVYGTEQGKQIYTLNGSTSFVQYSFNGTNINNLSNGFGISMNLLNSNVTYLECEIDSSLSINHNPAFIAASYQHATSDINLATSKSYYLSNGGLGDVFMFYNGIDGYYDYTPGTYYYLYT